MLKNKIYFFYSVIVLLLLACINYDKTSPLSGDWSSPLLTNRSINSLTNIDNQLFISSEIGLFTFSNKDLDTLGLINKDVLNVLVSDNNLISAISTNDFLSKDTTLYVFDESTNSWESILNNYGGDDNSFTYINSFESSISNNDILFAGGGGHIARSIDSGLNWLSVFNKWGTVGYINFFSFNSNNDSVIWSGGENAINEPFLVKSNNYGDNWDFIRLLDGFEASANDLIFDNNLVLVGISGTTIDSNIILKSFDNGVNWNTVAENVGIQTFEKSNTNDKLLFASGRNTNGTLFFMFTSNFGDTWQTIEFKDGPSNIYVHDIISMLENGKEVLYFATNQGLFSFTFEN